MSAVDEILSEIPINQLAGQLGVDAETAEQASRQALPALLGGIQANTDDPGGAASFARAVQQHDGSLVDGGVNLNQVDTQDGNKIVNHVFGPNRDQVVHTLGGLGGGQDLIAKLLPILAPIVMAWLAKKLSGAAAGAGAGGGAGAGAGGGGDLGSVLGGALGGGAGGAGGAGGGLGDLLGPILGSVLGGAAAGSGSGTTRGGGDPLGDLLGGLLGGGRR